MEAKKKVRGQKNEKWRVNESEINGKENKLIEKRTRKKEKRKKLGRRGKRWKQKKKVSLVRGQRKRKEE